MVSAPDDTVRLVGDAGELEFAAELVAPEVRDWIEAQALRPGTTLMAEYGRRSRARRGGRVVPVFDPQAALVPRRPAGRDVPQRHNPLSGFEVLIDRDATVSPQRRTCEPLGGRPDTYTGDDEVTV